MKIVVSSRPINMRAQLRLTVLNHLQNAEYTEKPDVWTQQELMKKNRIARITTRKMLLNRNKKEPHT